MKSRSRIRHRPGHGSAELSHEERRRSQHERAPAGGHRRHGWPFEEATSTKRGAAHAPFLSLSSHGVDGADGILQPHACTPRRRKRAHPPAAVSVPGGTNGNSFSRRSHRYRRPSALPMAAATVTAALATMAALSSSSILAAAAEMGSPEAPMQPVPNAETDHDDDVASSQRNDPSPFQKAGNLRRKADSKHPRQDMNVNADTDARHLSRVFADGRPSSNGFDFDVSFLDAPASRDNYYGDPVLITEMGRPQDNENQEETISGMYDNANPTLAARLDSDNHHHRPSTTTTPLTDALTTSGSSTVQARIVGGTKTPRPPNLRYPYMVSLQRRDYPICGAFLIAPDCILTAAHCRGSFDYAELGRWDLAADATESYQRFDILECTMHPSFTYFEDRQIGNDFMVCKLNGKADVDRYPPVQLNANPSVPQTSEAVTVVGWGRTASGAPGPISSCRPPSTSCPTTSAARRRGASAPGSAMGTKASSNPTCSARKRMDATAARETPGGLSLFPATKRMDPATPLPALLASASDAPRSSFRASTPGSVRPTPGSSPRRNVCPITVASGSSLPSLPLRPLRARLASQHRLPQHLRPLCLLPRQRHRRVPSPQACRR